jgi:hypothetical protein
MRAFYVALLKENNLWSIGCMIVIWHALVVNPMMENCFSVLPNVCAIFSGSLIRVGWCDGARKGLPKFLDRELRWLP